jgi:hypothetical protein
LVSVSVLSFAHELFDLHALCYFDAEPEAFDLRITRQEERSRFDCLVIIKLYYRRRLLLISHTAAFPFSAADSAANPLQ